MIAIFVCVMCFALGYVTRIIQPLRFLTGVHAATKAMGGEIEDLKAQLAEMQRYFAKPAPPDSATK